MTMYKPSLRLARLIITCKGKHVYDEIFHLGVNIVRGVNSSGKSTIVNFINFVLGGEHGKFTEEASMCDFVYAEVKINGENVSLRREIDNVSQRPLSIYWGPLEKAMEVGNQVWELYPYAARGSKESFSQVLFRALEIPEVRSEQMSARVTMHQLLRLIYSDQMTSPERIFRSEDFDYADVKDAVGRLVCGVYDDEIYDLKIRLKALEVERSVIAQQLKTVLGVLSDAEQIPNAMELEGILKSRKEKRKELYANLTALRSRKQLAEGTEGGKSKRVTELVQELQKVSHSLGEMGKKRREIIFEIEDTTLFIASLEEKLRCIEEAIETRKTLGTVDFEICPACYTLIKEGSEKDVCPLCKEKLREGMRNEPVAKLRQEIMFQIKESKMLQGARVKKLEGVDSELPPLRTQEEKLRLELEGLNLQVTTEYEAAVGKLDREIGYLDREIEDTERQLRLAVTLEKLSVRKGQIERESSELRDRIDLKSEEMSKRGQEAAQEIKKATVELLRRDLEREDALRDAETIEFNFEKDALSVNGRSNISASSKVILKNSFHLGLLIAATKRDFFRYPRLAIFDNIENMGMEPTRSQNFQRVIVETSASLGVEHQIIFTTSMIDLQLEIPMLTIGEHYTESNKSLRLG